MAGASRGSSTTPATAVVARASGSASGPARGSTTPSASGPCSASCARDDLDEAIALQNDVALRSHRAASTASTTTRSTRWLERVEVGNAYVNRHITGAIVRRQPFGGWKRSVVGPGAKAGGPNYVAQLGRWSEDGLPRHGQGPVAAVRALLEHPTVRTVAETHGATAWLDAAAHSDAWWWARELGVGHDPSALACEQNLFRYVPLGLVLVRIGSPLVGADAGPPTVVALARLLAAACCSAVAVEVSLDPDTPADLSPALAELCAARGVALTVERESVLIERLDSIGAERIRALGGTGQDLRRAASARALHIETAAPLACGRIELLRWLREQSVSRTMHRYGNLLGAGPPDAHPPGSNA